MGLSPLMELFGSIASSGINMYSQQQQNQHNEYLAQLQNQWNREQWMNEALYNSPSNQMARLRSAGINPALAYTNGIDNLAPASPEMVSSQGVAPNFGNPFAGFARNLQQDELVESQVKLNESAANRNNAQAGLYTTQTDIAGVRFHILSKNGEELSDLQVQTMRKSLDLMQANYENITADTAVKILEGEKLRHYIDEIQPAELAKIQSETGLNEAQTKQILELLPLDMLLRKAQATNQFAQGRLANAQARFQEILNDSDEYVQEFINSIRLDNEGKIVRMDIDLGNNMQAARVGSSYSNHYAGRYADVSHPASGSDQAIQGVSALFGVVGKLFSLIGKF